MQGLQLKRTIPPGSMVYNEWGELVDADELRKDPKSKKMEIKDMFRLINLNWHYRVSPQTFLPSFYEKNGRSSCTYPYITTILFLLVASSFTRLSTGY